MNKDISSEREQLVRVHLLHACALVNDMLRSVVAQSTDEVGTAVRNAVLAGARVRLTTTLTVGGNSAVEAHLIGNEGQEVRLAHVDFGSLNAGMLLN